MTHNTAPIRQLAVISICKYYYILSVTSKFLLQVQMQLVTQSKREFITDLLELFCAKALYIESMLL